SQIGGHSSLLIDHHKAPRPDLGDEPRHQLLLLAVRSGIVSHRLTAVTRQPEGGDAQRLLDEPQRVHALVLSCQVQRHAALGVPQLQAVGSQLADNPPQCGAAAGVHGCEVNRSSLLLSCHLEAVRSERAHRQLHRLLVLMPSCQTPGAQLLDAPGKGGVAGGVSRCYVDRSLSVEAFQHEDERPELLLDELHGVFALLKCSQSGPKSDLKNCMESEP
uniref:DHHA2 domain-containing protein n=1 Tax=Macrostomum lignano TaxID=282301 RepID=A0A1I8HXF6_9PLAT